MMQIKVYGTVIKYQSLKEFKEDLLAFFCQKQSSLYIYPSEVVNLSSYLYSRSQSRFTIVDKFYDTKELGGWVLISFLFFVK